MLPRAPIGFTLYETEGFGFGTYLDCSSARSVPAFFSCFPCSLCSYGLLVDICDIVSPWPASSLPSSSCQPTSAVQWPQYYPCLCDFKSKSSHRHQHYNCASHLHYLVDQFAAGWSMAIISCSSISRHVLSFCPPFKKGRPNSPPPAHTTIHVSFSNATGASVTS